MVLPNFFHPVFESKTPGPSYPQPPTIALPSTVLLVMAVPTFIAGLTLAPIESLGWTGVGLSMTPFAAARCAIYAALLLTPLASPRASA